MSYFNIHTHQKPQLENEVCIRNAFLIPLVNLKAKYWLSTGLHPWFVARYSKAEVAQQLQINLSDPRVLAVGEIGLDKLKPHYELQKDFFELQLNFAQQFQKPVIIHNVKGTQELRPYLKDFNGPVILHGFKDGLDLWNQLNPHGKTYLSIGKNIFTASKNLIGLIQQIPLNYLFAETDQSTHSIEKIYQEIAQIRNISLDELMAQISINFTQVFGKN